ncbi:MAG: hypothetical protein QXO01_00070 [Nitrososphaerota archaeon]
MISLQPSSIWTIHGAEWSYPIGVVLTITNGRCYAPSLISQVYNGTYEINVVDDGSMTVRLIL